MSYDSRITFLGKSKCYAYESITVATTAIGFTVTNITNCKRVYITAETATMRFRYDGTDPTSSEGHILRPDDIIIIEGYSNIESFRAIRTGATSGKLLVSFER
jgi:hypothetical protein